VGLLDDLKKQADALKAQDTDKTESLRGNAVAVDHALRRSFLYLNDLGKQLAVVQMPSPFTYKIPTVGDVSGLIVKDFRCDFRSKHFIDKDYYGEVHVGYRCFSDKQLSVKKGPDELEKFRDFLWSNNIEHKSEQFRDQRKVITHEVFKVVCDFRVQAKIEGDHESGKIKIVTKNVGEFEVDIFNFMAAEMNDQTVEEFAKFLIGRPNQWKELAKKSALTVSRTVTVAAKPKPATGAQPAYAPPQSQRPAAPKAPPAPPPEEKKGLFGSLKSLIKKDDD
jgi:hypothetical protein